MSHNVYILFKHLSYLKIYGEINWQLIGDRLLLGVIARKLFLSTQLKSTGVWPLEQGLQGPYRHKYWWWSLSGPQSQGLQPSNRLIWPWFMAWIWGQKAWNQHWMIVTSGVVMISEDSGNLTGISILMEPKLVPESLLVKVDFYHQQCHQRGQFLVTRGTNFLLNWNAHSGGWLSPLEWWRSARTPGTSSASASGEGRHSVLASILFR